MEFQYKAIIRPYEPNPVSGLVGGGVGCEIFESHSMECIVGLLTYSFALNTTYIYSIEDYVITWHYRDRFQLWSLQ